MKFNGQIIYFVKDGCGCIHLYKKKSKAQAKLEQYMDYIQSLETKFGDKLIRSFVFNQEDNKYIWGSSVWRTNLNKSISLHHQKHITYLEENRKEIMFIGPYKSMQTKGLHLCCYGHEWLISPNKVQNGETCPHCKKKYRESNGAKYITELLVANKIEFIKEVPLNRFNHEMDLRLDFVICQNNYPLFAIEFNGIQHYKPIKSDFFGGYKGFKERKKRDRIKREYCWSIGLPVVDIPYSETDEQIEETVLYFLRLFELDNIQTKSFNKIVLDKKCIYK
jgi:hypothetical protein